MDLILLEGPNDSGKSSTLHLVYAILLNLGAIVHDNKYDHLDGKKQDFRCVLTIDNRKVLMISLGDYPSKQPNDRGIISSLEKFKNENPVLKIDVAVCAYSEGRTDSKEELQNKGYGIVCSIKKTIDGGHQLISNIKDAMEVLRQITKFTSQLSTQII